MTAPCIVGAYEIPHRILGTRDLVSVFEEAALGALSDAGLRPRDVDGLFMANLPGLVPAFAFAEHLAIEPQWADTTRIGGTAPLAHVHHALAAIREKRCRVALVVYGSLSRSQRAKTGTGGVLEQIAGSREAVYGPTVVSRYGMFAQRHMHEYGTTMEQLAAPAFSARQWASLNPTSVRKEVLTIDEIVEAPTVSSPLTVPMCCVISDGGGAIIVADEAVAKDVAQKPIRILGSGEQVAHREGLSGRDYTESAVRQAARRAMGVAGITHQDIDLCTVYDSFTITVITALEDAGFCPKGEGGPFVEGGRLGPGGQLPTNPDGGGLATNHPGMRGIFLIIEMVRQLRGDAGSHQVKNAQVGIAMGVGGTLDSRHASAVLVMGQ